MDRRKTVLLSGFLEAEMALSDVVRRSFENIGPKNPLKRLKDGERRILLAILQFYVVSDCDPISTKIEEIAKIAADAGDLGRSIGSNVLSGPLAETFAPFVADFQNLPKTLGTFSTVLGTLIENTIGKRGHAAKLKRNQFLVMASEFVRQKTGKHYDEHLAELLQALPGQRDLNDTSGDAIRKKREHLKSAYPLVYRSVVDRVRTRFAV